MVKEDLVKQITSIVLNNINNKEIKEDLTVPIGVSARHIHLSQDDVEILFGKGHKLTPLKELMGGQFASKETVTIIGTKLRPIENVRILGPVRSQTQVEVSKTDAIRLGLNPPIRLSGNITNSSPVTIVGPKGALNLSEGCIIAQRHIHMNKTDAERFGVNDKEIVTVKVLSDRGGSLNHVQIRVDDSFRLEMHIDTDEANAMGISCNDKVMIVK